MSKTTFADGYVDGWQAIKPGTNPPGIPSTAIPAGWTPYNWGYEKGREAALNDK